MTDTEVAKPPFTYRRIAVIVAVVLVGIWVGWTSLGEPDLPDFEASGDPIELPA